MILLDMEAPKSCFDCPLYNQGFCDVSSHRVKSNHVIMRTKPNDCPIKAEIPTDSTNGDVIKAIFPNLDMVDDFCRSIGIRLNNSNYVQFNKDWWSAPWKGQENAK